MGASSPESCEVKDKVCATKDRAQAKIGQFVQRTREGRDTTKAKADAVVSGAKNLTSQARTQVPERWQGILSI